MAKLSSLEELRSLLSEEERNAVDANRATSAKQGYDGKLQRLTVALDSKRRRGKTVTLITGFQSSPDELEQITQALKKSCGAGGGVLDNAIEIQGDHRAKVVEKLKGMGFMVRGEAGEGGSSARR
jgi:translation initiation factor 1